MRVKGELKFDGFAAYMNELVRMAEKPVTFDDVLNFEAAEILAMAIRRTREANKEKAVASAVRRLDWVFNSYGENGPLPRNSRQTPRIIQADRGTFMVDLDRRGRVKTYFMEGPNQSNGGRRYSDARWQRFENMNERRNTTYNQRVARSKEKVLGAIGLSKQTWLQVGDNLGLTVKAPDHVRAAVAVTGRRYANGTGLRGIEGGRSFIELRNTSEIVRDKLRGQAILNGCISSRLRQFEKNMEAGLFEDLSKRAKKYPGIFVKYSGQRAKRQRKK